MTIRVSIANAQFDPSLLAELLARRWKEGRPYFALREHVEGMGLRAWWQQRPDHTGSGAARVAQGPRSGATDR